MRKDDFTLDTFLVSVLIWLFAVLFILIMPVSSTENESESIAEPIYNDGAMHGDDIPAMKLCYMDAEDAENEMIEIAILQKAHIIEKCTVTYYDCCVECCGKTDGITASGVRATPGVTVAVDPDVIPLGSDVLVDYGDGEIHYYRADDTDSAVKGNHIDLCVQDHQTAIELGVCTATVWWCES